MKMKLSDIIKNCGVLAVQGREDVEITSVTNDSRRVQPGSLFIAVNGCGNDGRAYLQKAIDAGAAAVLYETTNERPDVPASRLPSSLPADAGTGFGGANPAAAEASPSGNTGAASTTPTHGKPRKLTWKEQRELEAIEAELPKLEAEKAELEAKMSSGTLPYTELQAASERIQTLMNEISQREERWLELSD